MELDERAILGRLQKKRNPNIHSELHLFVDEVRTYFGEEAKKGKGSFGFYIGFFNRLTLPVARRIFGEIQESAGPGGARLFWWKVKQEFIRRKEENNATS